MVTCSLGTEKKKQGIGAFVWSEEKLLSDIWRKTRSRCNSHMGVYWKSLLSSRSHNGRAYAGACLASTRIHRMREKNSVKTSSGHEWPNG